MTIAQSNVLAIATNNTAASSFTTASGSPAANRTLLWFQSSANAPTHNAPTAWGLTWEQVYVQTNVCRQSCWVACTGSTAPSSGTATVNFATNATAAAWYVAQFTNVAGRNPAVPSQAIRQSNTATHTSASGGTSTAAASLANALASSLSAVVGGLCNDTNSTATTTAERTSLGSASFGTVGAANRSRMQCQWNLVGDTQMTTTWTGVLSGVTGIVELAHEPAPQPLVVPSNQQVAAVARSRAW